MRSPAIALCFVTISTVGTARAEAVVSDDLPPPSERRQDERPPAFVLSLSPATEVALVGLQLGVPGDNSGYSVGPGSVGVGATATAGWRISDSLFAGIAASYVGYPTQSTQNGALHGTSAGSAQAESLVLEIGHLRARQFAYRIGVGARLFEAASNVRVDDELQLDRSALFFGPTAYVAGGYAFALRTA